MQQPKRNDSQTRTRSYLAKDGDKSGEQPIHAHRGLAQPLRNSHNAEEEGGVEERLDKAELLIVDR